MTCFECSKEIDSYPCACGYAPTQAKEKRSWLLQSCAEPGCTVVIRSLPGEQEPTPRCKWHKGGTAYNSDNIRAQAHEGPLISKDEFGQDLFEAIRLQAALRQAEKTAEIYQRKGLKRQERESREHVKNLNHQLSEMLNKNTVLPADLKRVLAIT